MLAKDMVPKRSVVEEPASNVATGMRWRRHTLPFPPISNFAFLDQVLLSNFVRVLQ